MILDDTKKILVLWDQGAASINLDSRLKPTVFV